MKLFLTAGGLSILEISSKRPRSRDNISHCDVISKDSDHQRGHQIKNLKLVLNRNFIAEAADAASPAVVTIGLR